MDFCFAIVVLFCGISFNICEGGIVVLDGDDPGSCDKSNHAEEVLVKDRENKEKILICTENKGIYQWRTIDGVSPPGELFNPGYDCSNILDKDPEAKDGFYWIQLDGNVPKKVWCDMTTDGGGFMLIGRKNDSVTWTVPSNNYPVEPFGDRHWSSALGDAPILDFRIQMATSEDFKQTKAHWSFRLQSKRPLKNLMIMNQGGCGSSKPGIGDIAYVKDLQTEKIVTTTFRCSIFGLGHHPALKFGWVMMNSCLQRPCSRGFAFYDHPIVNLRVASSGAFSYSVTGNASGIHHDSTAFIGCDNNVCCACYGPFGGTGNYCGDDCHAKPGGIITKNVYTWFWVRSALPKRIWNKCMEYKLTGDNGNIVWYKLKDGSGVPKKGRCSKNEVLLNDGIVVVPDSAAAQKIPSVPGLLEYRKYNKKLYVRANKTWNVVAEEDKVLEKTSKMVEPKLNQLEKKLDNQNQKVINILNTNLTQVETRLGSVNTDFSRLKTQLDNHVNTDFSQLKARLGNVSTDLSQIKTRLDNHVNTDLSRLEAELRNVNQTLSQVLNTMPDYFSSHILLGRADFLEQIKYWLPVKIHWHLCYRATRDGWAASTFHSRCNNKGDTVTIVRVGQYIFGGYNDLSWTGSGGSKSSSNAFLFSLRNKDNLKPFKAPVYRNSQYAIHDGSSYGPIFGGGNDLYIANNAHSSTSSYTNFGYTYQPPSGYSYGSSNTQALLAGSYHFTPSEVEVFYFG